MSDLLTFRAPLGSAEDVVDGGHSPTHPTTVPSDQAAAPCAPAPVASSAEPRVVIDLPAGARAEAEGQPPRASVSARRDPAGEPANPPGAGTVTAEAMLDALLGGVVGPACAEDPNLYVAAGLTWDALSSPGKYPDPVWQQPALCSLMQAVITHGLNAEGLKGALIEIHPEAMKSEQVTQRVAWEIAKHDRWPVLFVSANDQKSSEHLQHLRRRLVSPFHRRIFPRALQPAAGEGQVTRGEWSGNRLFFDGVDVPVATRCGLHKSVEGARANLLVLDDGFTREGQISEQRRRREWSAVSNTWLNRIGAKGRAIITNNNWDPRDGFHRLAGRGPEGAETVFACMWCGISRDSASFEVWLRNVPMAVIEAALSERTEDEGEWARREGCEIIDANASSSGEALIRVPRLPFWSEAEYQAHRALGRIEFERVYMGLEPRPETSLFGLRTEWTWADAESLPGLTRILGFHDPAAGKANGCFAVTALLGLGEDNRVYRLLTRVERSGWSRQAEALAEAQDFAGEMFPGIPCKIWVEDNANQWSALKPEVERVQAARREAGQAEWALNLGAHRTADNKDQRIRRLEGPVRHGELVFVNGTWRGEPWIGAEDLAQMENYPDHRWVDGPDAVASAWRLLRGPERHEVVLSEQARGEAAAGPTRATTAGAAPTFEPVETWLSIRHSPIDGTRAVVASLDGQARLRVDAVAELWGPIASVAQQAVTRLGAKRRGSFGVAVLAVGPGQLVSETAYEFHRAGLEMTQGWPEATAVGALEECLRAKRIEFGQGTEAAREAVEHLVFATDGRGGRQRSEDGSSEAYIWSGDAGYALALGNLAAHLRQVDRPERSEVIGEVSAAERAIEEARERRGDRGFDAFDPLAVDGSESDPMLGPEHSPIAGVGVSDSAGRDWL